MPLLLTILIQDNIMFSDSSENVISLFAFALFISLGYPTYNLYVSTYINCLISDSACLGGWQLHNMIEGTQISSTSDAIMNYELRRR